MHIEQTQQIRKIAILVASLEPALADRLLADLPVREAAAVREIVAGLEEIDLDEYQAAVSDFQNGISEPKKSADPPTRTQLEGVELDESLLARMAAPEQDGSYAMDSTSRSNSTWQALSDADTATLVQILSAEQPQTIAIVLSRLETARAAELIDKLAPSLQTEVLVRLAELDPADEQTVQVVASQLAQWITEQRQRKQRLAAGCELVQNILEKTPYAQRTSLLARLDKRNPNLVASLTTRPVAKQTVAHSFAGRTSNMQAAVQQGSMVSEAAEEAIPPANDPLSELEALDDRALKKALSQVDRQIAMLALAGASDSLIKRIVRGLPRRQANQFRQQLRTIGPTRLGDMLAAQQELVRLGR